MRRVIERLFFTTLFFVFLSGVISPVTAHAQDDDEDIFMLQEITVTAEKRTENVQKTAVSVSTLDGDTLTSTGRTLISEILKDVPGITISGEVATSDNPAASITIRGVPSTGGGTPGVSNTASSAYYVDGVYNGLGGELDMSRVEVLRGPQGTLYGRSATSGVVASHTQGPKLGEFEGNLTGETGSYDLIHLQGAVNIPVGDTLAVRIAARHYARDGVLSEEGGKQKNDTVRAKVLWEPTDEFTALLGYVYRKDDNNSGGASMTTYPGDVTRWYTEEADILNKETTQQQVWGQFDLDTKIGTVTYLPAFRTYETGGSELGYNGWITQYETVDTDYFMTHELRLSSPESDSPLQWVVGGMYYENQLEPNVEPHWTNSGALNYQEFIDKNVKDLGLFGEATYELAPTLRLTAGLRYDSSTVEWKDTFKKNIGGSDGSVTDSDYGWPEELVSTSDEAELDFENVTYKLRVEKDLTSQNMIYAMVSTGFLPGDMMITAQELGGEVNFTTLEYDQQKLTSYEIGAKNRFFDNRLQLNGSIFYYDYEGYQVYTQMSMADFVILSSPAVMWGGEIEASCLLTINDRIDFSYGHTDAKFVDQPDTEANPFATWVGQDEVPNISPDTASLGYTHTFNLANGSILNFSNQLRFQAACLLDTLTAEELAAGAEPFVSGEDEWLDDANLSWISPAGKYGLTLYVKNVTDEEYIESLSLQMNTSEGWQSGVGTSTPRTWGVTLNVNF
jgi:iron complex outermembrane receptor protein